MTVLKNCLLVALIFCWNYSQAQILYSALNGTIDFKSDAPLEMIEAASHELQGVIDLEKRTFAFAVRMKSFQGFNSPLQKVHFNENYLESPKYPRTTFLGKIIEQVNLQESGMYSIRAKGKLNIHGVEQERIIKSTIEVKDGKLIVKSFFTVLLKEHNIAIPKIVNQKIAEEIKITVVAEFTKKES